MNTEIPKSTIIIDPILKLPSIDIGKNRYFCTNLMYKSVIDHQKLKQEPKEPFHFFEGNLNVVALPSESETVSFLLDIFEQKISIDNNENYHRIKHPSLPNKEFLVSGYFTKVFSSLLETEIVCNQNPIHGNYIALAPQEVPTFNFIFSLFQVRENQKQLFN